MYWLLSRHFQSAISDSNFFGHPGHANTPSLPIATPEAVDTSAQSVCLHSVHCHTAFVISRLASVTPGRYSYNLFVSFSYSFTETICTTVNKFQRYLAEKLFIFPKRMFRGRLPVRIGLWEEFKYVGWFVARRDFRYENMIKVQKRWTHQLTFWTQYFLIIGIKQVALFLLLYENKL